MESTDKSSNRKPQPILIYFYENQYEWIRIMSIRFSAHPTPLPCLSHQFAADIDVACEMHLLKNEK